MIKDCPQKRGHAEGNAQPRPNLKDKAAAEPPKRNRLYALNSREEQAKSADMVIGMLEVFLTSVYNLLYPRSTLSFVTHLLALTFEILHEVLDYAIVDSTPLTDNLRTDRVYKDRPIVVCGKTICADFFELPMHEFYVIPFMD